MIGAAQVGKLPDLATLLDPPQPDTRTADDLIEAFDELDDMASAMNPTRR